MFMLFSRIIQVSLPNLSYFKLIKSFTNFYHSPCYILLKFDRLYYGSKLTFLIQNSSFLCRFFEDMDIMDSMNYMTQDFLRKVFFCFNSTSNPLKSLNLIKLVSLFYFIIWYQNQNFDPSLVFAATLLFLEISMMIILSNFYVYLVCFLRWI